MADDILDSIPITALPSGLLLISRPIIPYDDLNIKGSKPTYLELFRDVGFNLSMIAGMSENGPKMISVTPDNAMRVASVGSGITNFRANEFQLLNGGQFTVDFGSNRHVWVVTCDAAATLPFASRPDCFFHLPDGTTSDTFSIDDGERWIFDILARSLFIENFSTQTCVFKVWGFDYTNIQDSLVVAH